MMSIRSQVPQNLGGQDRRRWYRVYCQWMSLSIVAISFSLAAVNWLIDPYDVYCHSMSSGFRSVKTRLIHRISKAEIARRGLNEVLLLGDSRVGYGLDPKHPALVGMGRTTNVALAAGSIYENSRMFDLATAGVPPKTIVWGVPAEFVYRDRFPKTEFDFDASLLNPQISLGEYHSRNLLSMNATKDSFAAITGWLYSPRKSTPSPTDRQENGANETRPDLEVAHATFVDPLPSRGSHLVVNDPLPDVPESEEHLRRCFNQSRQCGIQLKVFVPPIHAVYLERMHQLGLSDRLENGKRILVKLAMESNRTASSAPPIEIWDFSGFSGPRAEQCPSAMSSARMHWYIDAIHFTPALGNLVLNQMFEMSSEFSEFGVHLTDTNVEEHLAGQRDARRQYESRHEGQIQMAVGNLKTRL